MKTAIGVLGLGIALFCATEAPAQQLQGQSAVYAWIVPGVFEGSGETFFMCTNTLSTSVRVGVEVLDGTGAVVNDASASSREIPAGGTVTFGTSAAFLQYPIDSEICPCPTSKVPLRGFARILATTSFKASAQVLCVAVVASDARYADGNPIPTRGVAFNLPAIRPENAK